MHVEQNSYVLHKIKGHGTMNIPKIILGVLGCNVNKIK